MWEAKPGNSANFDMCLDNVRINRPGGAAAQKEVPKAAATGGGVGSALPASGK
jgi:hypothetical protein